MDIPLHPEQEDQRDGRLGSLDDFTLAEARDRTRRYRQILADGHDPIECRREEKAKLQASQLEANRRGITFSDCAESPEMPYRFCHFQDKCG